MRAGFLHRVLYSPFLTQMVIIRRCNLSCGYCNEFDTSSEPVPYELLLQRMEKIRELGSLGMAFTGGEPTMHPELPQLIRKARSLGFARTGMISNGFFLRPDTIEALNEAGLHEMQISIDGIQGNDVTQKVLNNLRKRLLWLKEHARFQVTVSGVIGACPPEEAYEIVSYAAELGFRPRVLLVHDSNGRLKLSPEELHVFEELTKKIPRSWQDFTDYRTRLVQEGTAPYKCRAGSRYLYVDEHGNVSWCSQTRHDGWSKPLADYTLADLKEQFYSYKSCQNTCTLGCVRSCSQMDGWRSQDAPAAATDVEPVTTTV